VAERHAEARKDRRRQLQLVEQHVGLGTLARPEIIEREILHLVVMTAVMATVGLTVIGGDDDFVAGFAPARQEGGEHAVHRVDGIVHLVAVVAETVPNESSVQVCRRRSRLWRLVSMVNVANRSTSFGVIWLRIVAGHGVNRPRSARPLVELHVLDQIDR
jgi:hypothetical protein